MKKILAIILILASVFAISSCDETDTEVNGVEKFASMYAHSAPTKVVTNHVVSIGLKDFSGTSTLIAGVTASGLEATTQFYEYQTIQTIESGATQVIIPITGTPIKGSREYLEGKGERVDGKKWDSSVGYNFAPTPGSIAINLTETLVNNVNYSVSGNAHSLIFSVPKENCASVFGMDYGANGDISVVLSGNGAEVTGITITYTADVTSSDEKIVFPDAKVTISTVYSYNIELVTIG